MSAKRHDILVVCNHGDKDGPYEFVQRFHWRDGAWIPMDVTGEKWNFVGGSQGPFTSAEAIADALGGRPNFNTECCNCGATVKMDGERAQAVLTMLAGRLAGSGLAIVPPVPLRNLREEYERSANRRLS